MLRRPLRRLALALLVVSAVASPQAQQLRKIGEMELALVGLSATVDGARPAIPKNIAAGVKILVSGGGTTLTPGAAARLLGTFTIKGELSGPSLGEAITVHQTITSASVATDLILPLPSMAVSGEHALSNLRIVNADGNPILDLQPGFVPVDVVEQVLITSVKSRPLTLQEIRDKGIVLDSDDYKGFEFTLGVLMESKPVNLSFPVVFDRQNVPLPIPQSQPGLNLDSVQVPLPQPKIIPMMMTVPKLGPGEKITFDEEDIRIPSLLVIPGEVGFLKQFFSAQLFVGNGTPVTANLVVKDAKGTLKLLDGPDRILHTDDDPFSQAETVKGTQPLTMPIVMPGPDALFGTSDDVTSLQPGEQGQAEFLIRGDNEGFHKLEFDIDAVLEGLPTGPIKVTGKAVGGVLVRNAAFDVTFTLPTVVRAGEPFTLYATVTNIGEGIGNDVTMTLDAASLSGLELTSDAAVNIETLMPGDAETLEFDFMPDRTGQVVATYLKFEGEGGSGNIKFRVGVGERNVPLSPDTLVLPAQAELLPGNVLSAAMRVLGQAWSVANTPPNLMPAGVTRISKQTVTTKALALAEAGLRMKLGQPTADAIRDLLPDFHGPSPVDRGFDQLLRMTNAGRNFDRAVGAALAPAFAGNVAGFEQAYAGVAASGQDFISFSIANGGAGANVNVTLSDNAGRMVSFTGQDTDPRPQVTSAAIAPLGAPQSAPLFGLVAAPTAGPYRLDLTGRAGSSAVDLTATYPRGDGSFTRVSATGINVPEGAKARLAFDPSRPSPVVEIDANADGTVDTTHPLTVDAVSASGPRFLSASIVGPETFDSAGPFGFNVVMLFDRIVNADLADDLSRYTIPDNQFVMARRQLSGRLVLGALAQPEGPYIPSSVTVNGLTDLRGVGVGSENKPLVSLLRDPGAVVSGRVINGDGQLASGVQVVYLGNSSWKECQATEPTAFSAVKTDSAGRYQFRYVVQDRCGWAWQMRAIDSVTGTQRSVYGNVRAPNERITADIALLGRGSVTGIVRDSFGAIVPGAQVIAVSVLDHHVGGSTLTDGDGRYLIPGITVGAVSIKAGKGMSVGTATAQIARAGTTGTADVTLNAGSVSVSGTVEAVEGGAAPKPAVGAVVVFAGPDPQGGGWRNAGVSIADEQGRYSFSAMPAGGYQITAILPSNERATITGIASAGVDYPNQLISVHVTRNARVSGTVKYANGTVVPNPIVTLSQRGVVGNADGTFTIEQVEVKATPQAIWAQAPDGLREGSSSVLVNENGQHVTGVTVTLNGVGTLNLTVIDSAGQPVRNQIVQISRTGGYISPTDCTAFHLAPTNNLGEVQFAGLHVGPVRAVSIRPMPDGVDIASLNLAIPYEGAEVSGVMRFGGGGVISGQVLAADGRKVHGAEIEVTSQVYNNGLCQMVHGVSHRVRTDLEGRYRVTGVPVGHASVKTTHFVEGTIGASGVLLRNGDELVLNMRYAESVVAGELTGHVFLPDGVTRAGAGVAVSAIGSLPEVLVRTDDTGFFKFPRIFPQGNLRITVSDPITGGVAQETVTLQAGKDAVRDFRLKGRGTVRVDVLDGGGVAVSNALVTLIESEFPNQVFEAVVEESNHGVVIFDRVHEGRFSVSASDREARGGRSSGELPGPNAAVNVTVRLTVTGTVTGRFTLPDATPVPFGTVRLVSNGRVIGQTTTSASDPVGTFRFEYVPAGTVRLEAQDPATGRNGVAIGQIITDKQQLVLDVRAEGLGTVRGEVKSNGVAQQGARVQVSSGNFRAHTTADNAGVFEVPGVPEGAVTVTADLEGALQGSATGTLIGDGTSVTINVALQASGSIEGIVTRSDGVTPAPPSIVSLFNGIGYYTTTTNAAGAYRFDLVPAMTRPITVDVIGSIDTAVVSATIVGGQTTNLPIRLVGVGGITGVARKANGAPAGGTVTLTGMGSVPYNLTISVDPVDGTFSAPAVLAGPFSAKVRHVEGAIATYGTAAGTVPQDGTSVAIEVTLQDTGDIRGTVHRADGATPAIGANVTLKTAGGGNVTTTQVLSDGTFVFTGIPLGTYSVSIVDPSTNGYAQKGNLVLADEGDIADAGILTLDDGAVTVVSITPADGTTGVSLTTPVVVVFTDALDGTSGVNVKHDGNTLGGLGRSLSADGKTLTLTRTWPDSAELTVEVTPGVTDLFGRHPAVTTTSRFRTVDTTGPSASVVPIDGAFQVPATPTITVTFSEPIVNASVDGLIVLTGPGGIATGVTAHGPPNVLTFTPNLPLADNAVYTVTVDGAVDASGNEQGSARVTTFATNDTVAPVLTINAPSLVNWTNDATPSISIGRSDATSGNEVSSGTLSIDGAAVTPAKFTSSLSYTVPAPLADGDHAIAATSADRAGNIGSVSGTFRLDATPPSIASITNIAPQQVITGPLTVTATATDSGSGVARIELRRDGQTVLNLLPPAFSDTWSVSSTNDGPYTLTARAVDAAGNPGPVSAPIPIIVNKNQLTVTITAPLANLRTRKPVDVAATVNEPVKRVEFTLGSVTETIQAPGPYATTLPVDGLPDGEATVTARAIGLVDESVTATRVIVIDRSSPIARWPFEEGSGPVTADASGNSHTGTLENGAAWSAVGFAGRAIAFDGVDDAIGVNDSDLLDATPAVTLAGWTLPASFGAVRTVIDKAGAYSLAIGADGRPEAVLQVGGTAVVVQGVAPVAVNAWSHLAVTYDGATAHLFVNGVAVASTEAAGSITATASGVWIGRTEVTDAFAGKLDEVRIYDRALSAAEVQLLVAPPISGTMMDGGDAHSLVAQPGGSIWSVGQGAVTGNGSTSTKSAPTAVANLTDVAAIASGSNHAFAITKTGTLLAWGSNQFGKLGDGTFDNRSVPTTITAVDNVIQVAAGQSHTVALRANGDAYTWGSNSNGQLGDGTLTATAVPKRVMTGVRAVAAGVLHTLFVKTDGTVWAAGDGGHGKLGHGLTSSSPTPVQMLGITNAVDAAATGAVSIVRLADGTLKGAGVSGFLGIGVGGEFNISTPTAIVGMTDVVALDAGQNHVVALKSNGTVWTWGQGNSGQLGLGTTSQGLSPAQVPGLSDIAAIGAGWNASFAASSSGIVYAWGANSAFTPLLFDGSDIARLSPVAVSIENYEWRVASPRFNPYGSVVHANRVVQVNNVTPGVTMHYTLDGAVPTEADPTVASGASLTLTTTATLSVRAFVDGRPPSLVMASLYRFDVFAPTINVAPGVLVGGGYNQTQTVSFSNTTTPDATYYYTVGTAANPPPTPTESSTLYTGPFQVSSHALIKVRGFKTGYTPADASRTLNFNYGTLAVPAISPGAGTHVGPLSVTLTETVPQPGAVIRYTTNNTTPSTTSTLYTGPFALTTNTTVRARVFHDDYTQSAETQVAYTLQAAAPQFSLASGEYPAGTLVTVTGNPASTIRYTLDGDDPTATDPIIASGGTLVVGAYTLKARAFLANANPSAVTSATYTVAGALGPVSLSMGDGFALLVTPDGRLFNWGWDFRGQLGQGNNGLNVLAPGVSRLTGVVAAGAGDETAWTSLIDGTLWGSGFNINGELGTGGVGSVNTPVLIPGVQHARSLSGGSFHSMAATQDGTVYAWGNNGRGQFGDGTTQASAVPKSIMGGVTAVAANGEHTLFLKSDGTVWGAGLNTSGQLGDGTGVNRSTPVQMSGITNAVAISAGMSHSVVLLADGTVRAVGAGQRLGDGSTGTKSTPVMVSGLTGIVAIDAGSDHTIALKSDGTVWSWGISSTGALGAGTGVSTRLTPQPIAGLGNVAAIAAGGNNSVAATGDGVILGWGQNTSGEVDGGRFNRFTPVTLSGPGYAFKVSTPRHGANPGTYFTTFNVQLTTATPGATIHYTRDGAEPTESDPSVPSGGTVLIDKSQTLTARAFKAGMPASNSEPQIYTLQVGQPSQTPNGGTFGVAQTVTLSVTPATASIYYTTDGSEPTEASTPYTGSFQISTMTRIKAKGFKADWAPSVTNDRTVHFNYGQLATPSPSPAPATYIGAVTVTLSAMPAATIHYTTNGTVSGTGTPAYTGPLTFTKTTRVRAKAAHTDWTTSAELDVEYRVQAIQPTFSLPSGSYEPGTLVTITGDPATTIRYTTDGDEPTASDLAIASGGTVAVGNFTLKARAFLTGADPSAVTSATYELSAVLALPSVTAGFEHSLAPMPDGRVFAWGSNFRGQFGNGTTDSVNEVPLLVTQLTGVKAMAAGADHSLAITVDGRLWAFGYNQFGQLGDTTFTQRTQPVQVSTWTNVAAVEAGPQHSIALLDNGDVYVWGHNSSGALCDGTTTNSPTPRFVMSGVVAISGGTGTTLMVKSDGTVWGCGLTSSGQLGDGPVGSGSRTTPVQMSGITSAVGVTGGGTFTVVQLADGTLRAAGASGRIGDGFSIQRNTPVPVVDLTDVVAIDAGTTHTLALKSDGTVWSWGSNSAGQLGNSASTGNQLSPVQITGLADIAAIGAGGTHSLAITSDRVVYGWGSNGNGEVGDGTTRNRFAPLAISEPALAWKAATPTFNIGPTTTGSPFNVTLSTLTSGALIHYTRNGSEPTQADPSVASGGVVLIDGTQTLTAKAFKTGMPPSNADATAYVLQVAQPGITPTSSGPYTTTQTVTITFAAGATARYTLDGSDPTEASTLYTAPFTLNTSTSVKAKAFRAGWTASATRTQQINFNYGTLAAPVISPDTGSYSSAQTVSITSSQPGATIRYSTNGSAVDSFSSLYTGPFLVTGSLVIQARAFHPDYVTSPQVTVFLTISTGIRVTYLDLSGNPVPGASVYYERPDGNIFGGGTTNASGQRTLTNLQQQGIYKIDVYDPDGSRARSTATVTISAEQLGSTTDVTVTQSPLGNVRVTVFAADGVTPYPFARVWDIRSNEFYRETDELGVVDFTNVSGTNGEIEIRVRHPFGDAWTSDAVQTGTMTADGETLEIPVTVAVGVIRGVVSYAGGEPVPYPEITATQEGPNFSRTFFAATDDAVPGAYVIVGPVAGEVALYAQDPDTMLEQTATVTVVDVQTPVTANVTMPQTGAVSGTVKDQSDQVMPYAWVSVTSGSVSRGVEADEFGVYTMANLPAGEITAQVDTGYGVQATATGTVVAGETLQLDLTLDPFGAVTGTVLDAAGTPVAGAMVSVTHDVHGSWAAWTDFAGTYHFPVMPLGQLSVMAMISGTSLTGTGSGALTAQGETAIVNVTMPPAGTVSGVARDHLGAPIAFGYVYLQTGAGHVVYTPANGAGEFVFQYVPVGPATVGAYSGWGLVGVTPTTVSAQGDAVTADVQIEAAPLTVTVTGSNLVNTVVTTTTDTLFFGQLSQSRVTHTGVATFPTHFTGVVTVRVQNGSRIASTTITMTHGVPAAVTIPLP